MIPGFRAAERAYEAQMPPDDPCDDGLCDECMECLAAIAQDQADELAEAYRDQRRFH